MQVEALDHVNIITDDLDGTAKFYEDLLGLERRDAPPPHLPLPAHLLEPHPVAGHPQRREDHALARLHDGVPAPPHVPNAPLQGRAAPTPPHRQGKRCAGRPRLKRNEKRPLSSAWRSSGALGSVNCRSKRPDEM